MAEQVYLGIDQSTQGTKALLFDRGGRLIARADRPHRQIVDARGWVEHDPREILANTCAAVGDAADKAGIDRSRIAGIGLSNQRETCVAWDRTTGEPLYNAIVWQCGRAESICEAVRRKGAAEAVKQATGLNLSPYFSASKLAWILQNVPAAAQAAAAGRLCCGTIDSWLLFRLTKERVFRTDYSNASRTQLFNITKLAWDSSIAQLFGVPADSLAEVCSSDSLFGTTDLNGVLPHPVPVHAVLGDSHAALFGQGCRETGSIKATYGTGSSVMMNIGDRPIFGRDIVTSLAWGLSGRVSYVLEGNLNYTGAIITWLKNDLGLIASSKEVGALAAQANPADTTVLVPAFSGLGAPYWNAGAEALLCGMTRLTGRKEIARAAEEAIACQIADIVFAMERDSGITVRRLRVDGGPTRDSFLMQFQSDILSRSLAVPGAEELSGIGAAFCSGIAQGFFDAKTVFDSISYTAYAPRMDEQTRQNKYARWKSAVALAMR